MLHFRKNVSEREEWWAVSDMTGEVLGPFDPGAVWFETPLHVCGGDLLRLQRVADLILDEAHAGWERLQRALAFMQPNGAAVYRRFMESGVLPRQTPALGLAGGLDVPAYLGDGSATGSAGLHIDDSHNGMVVQGAAGGAGGLRSSSERGGGPGGGDGGGDHNDSVASAGAGGGGGYGTAGGDASNTDNNGGRGGPVIPVGGIWEALRRNSFTQALVGFGSGGGGGGGGRTTVGMNGGRGGSLYLEIVSSGQLTTVARDLRGSSGTHTSNSVQGAGGGGAGGLWLGIASTIAYGSGTVNTTGRAGGRFTDNRYGGAGGNGRVIQVYFDSKATLLVTGAVEDQFRILRSVPIGQNTFL